MGEISKTVKQEAGEAFEREDAHVAKKREPRSVVNTSARAQQAKEGEEDNRRRKNGKGNRTELRCCRTKLPVRRFKRRR